MIVDFIYDVATPNGYLAHKVIPEFEKRTNTSFNYIPCLAGGIFKLTNNTPPLIANADVKNKSDYFFVEMNRWIKKHKIDRFKNNSNLVLSIIFNSEIIPAIAVDDALAFPSKILATTDIF